MTNCKWTYVDLGKLISRQCISAQQAIWTSGQPELQNVKLRVNSSAGEPINVAWTNMDSLTGPPGHLVAVWSVDVTTHTSTVSSKSPAQIFTKPTYSEPAC